MIGFHGTEAGAWRAGRRLLALCALAGALLGGLGAASTRAAAPVYAGKQIRMVIASGPGGGYDVYARILADHLATHIAGHPTIVPENMSGAAGRVAMNWAAHAAPRDGTVIVASYNAVLAAPLFGDQTAQFDPRQFASIGSIGKLQNICATWYTSPIKTIADAKTHTVTVSAAEAGSNSATLPAILNHMLGTKFHVVIGYSTGDMRLALERGEVQGICGLGWSTLKASNPEWINDHRLNILLQDGDKAQADLPNVPVLMNLVPTKEDRQILRALEFPEVTGRPFLMPPGTPKDMVDAVRAAFDATMKDPAFLADAKKARMEVDPVSGADMSQLIKSAYDTPPALLKEAAPFSGFNVKR